MAGVEAPAVPLWEPSDQRRQKAALTRYTEAVGRRTGRQFSTYEDLWHWSVTDIEDFWQSIWDFYDMRADSPPTDVLAERIMPGARWFPGARLNYAEHALRRRDDATAVLAFSEARGEMSLTFAQLAAAVGACAAGLRRLGVRPGDRVAGYLPNVPEAVVAFLATASLGAIWSGCPPEFGLSSVVDRWSQIEPVVIIAADGYVYGGKPQDRMDAVAELAHRLPSVRGTVLLPYLDESAAEGAADRGLDASTWVQLLAEPTEPTFEPVPFDAPLWVLYSSGTTGLPKGIVHGHGGMLLEHYKALGLHSDLGPQDTFFWFSTTGWMMWNFLVSGLLVGSRIVLFDGNPGYPDFGVLWRLAERTGTTFFGTSAPFVHACLKAGLRPKELADMRALRTVGSTGSPLSPEGFRWLYEQVKDDLLVGSISGGTDMCTAFVTSCPTLPVYAGELQCRALGAKVEAFDPAGQSVMGQVGELVITEPMPAMPVFFWNDPDGIRYQESYFEMYPGIWRHGDWIEINARGGCVISGRSDATLNRGGVRMGTADFYRVVESLPEVADSLVLEIVRDGESRLELFVVPAPGSQVDDKLRRKVAGLIRSELSPRHVPDALHEVAGVPKTLNGKKLEVPVRRILEGRPFESAVNLAVVANPEALEAFRALAERR